MLALPLLLSSMSTKTSNRCLPALEAAIPPLLDSPSRLSAPVVPRCHGNLCEGCILRLVVPAFHLPPSEGDPAGRCPVLCHGKACLNLDQGHSRGGELCNQNQERNPAGGGPERPWVYGIAWVVCGLPPAPGLLLHGLLHLSAPPEMREGGPERTSQGGRPSSPPRTRAGAP